MKEGRTKKEAIRCLKRYVAREVFAALPRSQSLLTVHRSIDMGHPRAISMRRFAYACETPSRSGTVVE